MTNYANCAGGRLNAGISDSVGSLTLKSGQGAAFPSTDFWIIAYSNTVDSGFEIMWCTSRTGDVLSVTRGQQGTSGTAWSEDDFIQHTFTASDMDALADVVQIKTGEVVGDLTTFAPTKKIIVTIDSVDYTIALDPV